MSVFPTSLAATYAVKDPLPWVVYLEILYQLAIHVSKVVEDSMQIREGLLSGVEGGHGAAQDAERNSVYNHSR